MAREFAVHGNWVNAPQTRTFKLLFRAKDYAQRLYVESLPSIGVMDRKVIIKAPCYTCGQVTMCYCYDLYGFHTVKGNCACTDPANDYHPECDTCAVTYTEGVRG